MSQKAQELAARYGRNLSVVEIAEKIIEEQNDPERYLDYHYNAFAHPICPVITNEPEIQEFRWGLIPFWVKNENQATEMENMTINAKAETIFTKPSFRQPILSRRCIVPSTGFFERRDEGSKKIPYFITVKDQEIFSFAGIYDVWKSGDNVLHTFSIITTEANELMSFIHNVKKRMPVILPIETEKNWLNPRLSKGDIANILKPYDSEKMEAYVLKYDFMKRDAPHNELILERA